MSLRGPKALWNDGWHFQSWQLEAHQTTKCSRDAKVHSSTPLWTLWLLYRLALCEKYPKISASHQCILLLAALMSGYVLGCPILISMEEKHPRQTQDPQSTHIGKQIFGSRSVEFWQFFVKIFSWKNYREQNLCLTGYWLCYFTSCVLVIYLPSLIICSYFDLLSTLLEELRVFVWDAGP